MSLLSVVRIYARNIPIVYRGVHALSRHEHFRRRMVRRGDSAVIEGYPRSANTFATYAFLEAQGEDLKLGNHCHTPAQITLARRYGIPAMVLLREPTAAVTSMLMFAGSMSADDALRRYVAFHAPLVARPEGFVVAPFDEVVGDFGRSIVRMNTAFGSSFRVFEHTDASRDRVFARISEDRMKRAGHYASTVPVALRSTTPTPEKEARKGQVMRSLERPELSELKRCAGRQYDVLARLV